MGCLKGTFDEKEWMDAESMLRVRFILWFIIIERRKKGRKEGQGTQQRNTL